MKDSISRNNSPLHVLAFAGSLREGSYNRALLRAAQTLASEDTEIGIFDLRDIPLYNADLDTDELRPEPVVSFKEAIGGADVLLIATPEYNHGISGVLKNAIDWASRPARRSVLQGKPVGIMGASQQRIGTARAQEQLKLVLEPTLCYVMPHPGVLVGQAGEKFDDQGRLTDEGTRQFVQEFLRSLARWARRFREHPQAAGTSDDD